MNGKKGASIVQSNGMLGGERERERERDRMQTDGQIDTLGSYQCRCLVALKFKLLFAVVFSDFRRCTCWFSFVGRPGLGRDNTYG